MKLSTYLELFGWSLTALVAIAIAAPLIGAFLCARGAAFQGIVLPQLATLGVAVGFALYPWMHDLDPFDSHDHGAPTPSNVYLLVSAGVATLAGLGWLGWARRARGGTPRGGDPGRESARTAALFAVASGGTVIASQLAPYGGLHIGALLSGEALAIGAGDMLAVLPVCLGTVAFIAWGWRDLTLGGHDPEFARVLGARLVGWERMLALVTAALVMVGTLTVGPLPLFALLVLPPLGARNTARSMSGFLIASAVAGFLGAAAGATLSFAVDLPMGASVVAGAASIALLQAVTGALWGRMRARS